MDVRFDKNAQVWCFESKEFGFSIPELTDEACNELFKDPFLSMTLNEESKEQIRMIVRSARELIQTQNKQATED
jgi:ribosome recycling factor